MCNKKKMLKNQDGHDEMGRNYRYVSKRARKEGERGLNRKMNPSTNFKSLEVTQEPLNLLHRIMNIMLFWHG